MLNRSTVLLYIGDHPHSFGYETSLKRNHLWDLETLNCGGGGGGRGGGGAGGGRGGGGSV